jgi:hypothetical protein
MSKTIVIGLSALLCLYLAFGLVGYAKAGCDLPTGPLWAIQVFTPKGWNTADVYFYSLQACEEYAKNNPPGNHLVDPNYYCVRMRPQNR